MKWMRENLLLATYFEGDKKLLLDYNPLWANILLLLLGSVLDSVILSS